MLQGCKLSVPDPFDSGSKKANPFDSGSKGIVSKRKSVEVDGTAVDNLHESPAGGHAAAEPGVAIVSAGDDMSFCNPLIAQESTEFQEEIQKDAVDYYNAVVKAFSLDFVQFPFCLENANFMVHALEEKMRGNTKYKDLPATKFEKKLNETIKDQYFKNEDKWRSMCQGWAEQNKAYQIAHLEMVRKVLGLEDSLTDEDLKAQIAAFYNWKHWWDFFSSMTKPGCARHYTFQCVAPTKVARRHAQELVMQTTGDNNLHWFALPDDLGDDPAGLAAQVGGPADDDEAGKSDAKTDEDAAGKSDAQTNEDEAGKSVAEKSDAKTDEDEAGKSVAEKIDAKKIVAEAEKSEAEAEKSEAEAKKTVAEAKKSVAEAKAERINERVKTVAEAKAELKQKREDHAKADEDEVGKSAAESEEDAAEKDVAPGSSLQTGQHWRSHHQAPATPRQTGERQHWRAHHQVSIELQAGNQQRRNHHT